MTVKLVSLNPATGERLKTIDVWTPAQLDSALRDGGAAFVNGMVKRVPRPPFGGIKASGARSRFLILANSWTPRLFG